MNFKYKTTFANKVRCLVPEETDKYLSLASLDSLKKLIPENAMGKGKQDLLCVASNLAVINYCNENFDAMTGKTALDTYKSLIFKFLDLEHSRKYLVGSIIESLFTTFSSDYKKGIGSDILKPEDIKDLSEPFNLAYSAVIYKLLFPELCEAIIESNDPESPNYLSISSSWEVGFENFSIAVGSRYLKDAEVIENTDEVKFKELEKYLKVNGGTGMKDGSYVYRVVSDGVIFLGAGLTETPASMVRGIFTPESENDSTPEETEAKVTIQNPISKLEDIDKNLTDAAATFSKLNDISFEDANNAIIAAIKSFSTPETSENVMKSAQEIIDKSKKDKESAISSVTANSNTDTNIIKVMEKITEISQITDESIKTCKASTVVEFIQNKIQEVSVKFDESEKAKKEIEKSHQSLSSELDTTKKSLETLEKEMNQIKAKENERAKQEKLNERVAALDEKFELTDEDRKFIIADIQDLEDEAYKKYETKMNVLLKGKVKKNEIQTSTASTVTQTTTNPATVINTAVSNGTQTTTTVPNTTSPAPETIAEQMGKAFKVNGGVKLQKR
jgi:hypothetical protein